MQTHAHVDQEKEGQRERSRIRCRLWRQKQKLLKLAKIEPIIEESKQTKRFRPTDEERHIIELSNNSFTDFWKDLEKTWKVIESETNRMRFGEPDSIAWDAIEAEWQKEEMLKEKNTQAYIRRVYRKSMKDWNDREMKEILKKYE
jgi:hypothetical protein